MNYFIAIVLPEPLNTEVNAFKQEMKSRFNSGQALYSPPHITLHMPFEWREDKEKQLVRPFERVLKGFKEFKVTLDGFGSFPPRVIFVNPEMTNALGELHAIVGETARKELNLLNQNRLERPFHPHVTIAFRDLRREQFNLAWPEFKEREYKRSFMCNSICILKKPGKFWEVYSEICIS